MNMVVKDYTESPATSDSDEPETPPISSDEETIPTAVLVPEIQPTRGVTGQNAAETQEQFREVTIQFLGFKVPAVLKHNEVIYVKRGTMELVVGEFESRNAIKFRLLLRRWVRTGRIMSHTIDLTTEEDFLNNTVNLVDDLFKLHEVAQIIKEDDAIGKSLLDLNERANFQILTEKFTGL